MSPATDHRTADQISVDECIDKAADLGAFTTFPLSHTEHREVLKDIVREWKRELGNASLSYFVAAEPSISAICDSPKDWAGPSRIILDAIKRLWRDGLGSYQYISKAIPSLVEKGLVGNEVQLQIWSDALVGHARYADKKYCMNGATFFIKFAKDVRSGNGLQKLLNGVYQPLK